MRKYTLYTSKEAIASKGSFQTTSAKFGFCCFFSVDLFASSKNSVGKLEKDILIAVIFVEVLLYVVTISNIMMNRLLKYKCFT